MASVKGDEPEAMARMPRSQTMRENRRNKGVSACAKNAVFHAKSTGRVVQRIESLQAP